MTKQTQGLLQNLTSIGDTTVPHSKPHIVTTPIYPRTIHRTQNTEFSSEDEWLNREDQTTVGITELPALNKNETNRTAIHELKKLSGLTWEQLAKLFNVTRRTLHFWASGQPLNRFNEQNLHRTLETVRYINRGSASINRRILTDQATFDLLVSGQYDEIKQILGAGHAPAKQHSSGLSPEAKSLRQPPKPDELINTNQSSIKKQKRRSRPAKSTRR